MKTTSFALAVLFIFIVIAAAFCAAQSAPEPKTSDASQSPATGVTQAPQPSGQATPPADQSQSKDKAKAKDKDSETSGTSKDRLFFALPNFLSVENAGKIQPLTVGQKFKVVAQGSFDPIQIVWYGALSGISQAVDSEPGFGEGAAAYGKRYGAYAADGTIENFFVGAILPSTLHQDPRFFPTTQGSFFRRTGYAVSRIVVTRGDSGHHEFNFSEVFGSAIASAISTYSYHPHPGYHPQPPPVIVPYVASDRTLKNTASVWGTQVGYDTITLVVKEFWPDIRRKLKKQPH